MAHTFTIVGHVATHLCLHAVVHACREHFEQRRGREDEALLFPASRRKSRELAGRRNRRGSDAAARVFCLLMGAYFLILVGAVLSVSFFASKQNSITARLYDTSTSGACILFAGHDNTHVQFPDTPLCSAVIWILVLVAIAAFLMCLGSCLRCLANLKRVRKITP